MHIWAEVVAVTDVEVEWVKQHHKSNVKQGERCNFGIAFLQGQSVVKVAVNPSENALQVWNAMKILFAFLIEVWGIAC